MIDKPQCITNPFVSIIQKSGRPIPIGLKPCTLKSTAPCFYTAQTRLWEQQEMPALGKCHLEVKTTFVPWVMLGKLL